MPHSPPSTHFGVPRDVMDNDTDTEPEAEGTEWFAWLRTHLTMAFPPAVENVVLSELGGLAAKVDIVAKMLRIEVKAPLDDNPAWVLGAVGWLRDAAVSAMVSGGTSRLTHGQYVFPLRVVANALKDYILDEGYSDDEGSGDGPVQHKAPKTVPYDDAGKLEYACMSRVRAHAALHAGRFAERWPQCCV